MCDFKYLPNRGARSCTDRTCQNIDRRPKPGDICAACESTQLSLADYDCCGLPTCSGRAQDPCQTTYPPCGQEKCPYITAPSPDCIGQKCPMLENPLDDEIRTITSECGILCGAPTCMGFPKYTCMKDKRYDCNATCGIPICLEDKPPRKDPQDLLDDLRYVDFSKYTFNKNKYLPNTYLPGDGINFLQGYKKPSVPQGPCGFRQCPDPKVQNKEDDMFTKLMNPFGPLPSLFRPEVKYGVYNSCTTKIPSPCYCPTDSGSLSYDPCKYSLKKADPPCCCPSEGSSSKITCPEVKFNAFTEQPAPAKLIDPCNPPCPPSGDPCEQFKPKKPKGPDMCGAPDCCQRSNNSSTCGGKDCHAVVSRKKKGCGAPDCKYANFEAYSKRKKRKHQGDFDSSCSSKICPFIDKTSSDSLPCDNPECPFAKGNEECMDKSCPNLKELVVCQDCGGVIVGEIDLTEQNRGELENQTDIGHTPIRTSLQKDDKDKKKSVAAENNQGLAAVGRNTKKSIDFSAKSESSSIRRKRKKKDDAFYTYPGTILGHKTCSVRRKNVPPYMGWLWTTKPDYSKNIDLWRGYKPGAISRTVYKIIQDHRRILGIYDPSEIFKKRKSKSNQRTADKNKRFVTLSKRDGSYFVTVNPVKDPQTTDEFESPYLDCTPIQFKVIKEKEPKKEKEKDAEGCTCDEESDTASESSSDRSELDFSFSPPAALPKPKQKMRKSIIEQETQYNKADFRKAKKKKRKRKKK